MFVGGAIHSLTERGRLSALAIRGDRIVAVGEAARAMLARGARRVDLGGRALYPGFIDAHSHWFGDWQRVADANPEWTEVRSPVASLRKAVGSGWTTITEHFASRDRLAVLDHLDARGLLPVRVNAYLPANWRYDDFGSWYLAYEPGSFVSPSVRIAGVKFFVDGGLTFFLREPFETCAGNAPGFRGEFFWDRDALERRMREVDRAGYQMTVHCMGDAATDVLLDILSAIDPGASNPRRHNLTHLILLHDAQIERLRRQRIVANIQLSWFHAKEADTLVCLLGDERVLRIGRWRDLVAAGVPTTGSTDFPWGVPILGPVLRTLYTATTRIGPNGEQPTSWMTAQTLSSSEAIFLLTRAAAWALREERVKGALRPGMLADLVVFSQDPLAVQAQDLLGIDVAMTVVGGEVKHLHPDHADLGFAFS